MTKEIKIIVSDELSRLMKTNATRHKLSLAEFCRQMFQDFAEVSPKTRNKLRSLAEQRSVRTADLVDNWFNKLHLDEKGTLPVLLRIPQSISLDRERLLAWLEPKLNTITARDQHENPAT